MAEIKHECEEFLKILKAHDERGFTLGIPTVSDITYYKGEWGLYNKWESFGMSPIHFCPFCGVELYTIRNKDRDGN